VSSNGSDDLHVRLVAALKELEQLASDAGLEGPLDVAIVIFMVRWLVVGRGRCGRGPIVGVARATSAADGRGDRRDG
jgi:hypothetical protein